MMIGLCASPRLAPPFPQIERWWLLFPNDLRCGFRKQKNFPLLDGPRCVFFVSSLCSGVWGMHTSQLVKTATLRPRGSALAPLLENLDRSLLALAMPTTTPRKFKTALTAISRGRLLRCVVALHPSRPHSIYTNVF